MENPLAPGPLGGPTSLGSLEPVARGPLAAGLPFQDLGRWLYTHNPFYAVSAGLVFWGLRSSFDTQVRDFHTFALMGGLVAYTLLLALAAYIVIRVGKVWEDGRTLLVLLVLMFLAFSVSFDDALVRHARNGTICYLGGLLLAVFVTEALLRGLGCSFPPCFGHPTTWFWAYSFSIPSPCDGR